jgi:N-acetylmuramoyl-L-alanine amidase
VLLFLALLTCMPAWAAASRLQAVELETTGEGSARLVLAWDQPPRLRLFLLDNPRRLVVDQVATQAVAGLRLPAAGGPVHALRQGVQPGGVLRLVLELPPGLAWRQVADAGDPRRRVIELGEPAVANAAPASGAPVSTSVATVSPPPAAAPAAAPVAAPTATPVAVRPAHAPSASGRDIIIAVDAGHGGEDPGAIGRNGTREKDVVLAIARLLAQRIDAEPGMRAYLVRDSDRFIPLRERMVRARAARADLFVSIHADAVTNRSVTGSSVYVLSERGASSEAARWLAERENAADLRGGISLGDKGGALAEVLMDLSQNASLDASMDAAVDVLAELDQVGTVRKTRVQQAGFVVLKSPDTPSMLVETAFISNPDEEKRLRTPQHQEALARAVFNGLRDHFRRSPPDGSLFALQRQRGGGVPVIAAGAP